MSTGMVICSRVRAVSQPTPYCEYVYMNFVDSLETMGHLSALEAATLRRARAETAEDVYTLATRFPGLMDIDATTLSAYAAPALSAASLAEIRDLPDQVPPASMTLGALPTNDALDQSNDILSASPAPLSPVQVQLVSGPSIDLRPPVPWPIRDQWLRGTCVAHAVVALAEHLRGGASMSDFSEQFLFAHCKKLDGIPHSDGTWIDYARQVLGAAMTGVCDEQQLRYNPTPVAADVGQISSLPALAPPVALTHVASSYARLTAPPPPGRAAALAAMLNVGRPVAISVPVFYDPIVAGSNNWNVRSAVDFGEVLDPLRGMLAKGGHAVCVTGYFPDPTAAGGGWFVLRNSWSEHWGRRAGTAPRRPAPAPGYGAISAEYVERFVWEMCQL